MLPSQLLFSLHLSPPNLAALDALHQGYSAPLHMAIKDVIQGHLAAAPFDDVTAHLVSVCVRALASVSNRKWQGTFYSATFD